MSIPDAARVKRSSKLPWQVTVAVTLLWTALLWPVLGFLVSRRLLAYVDDVTGSVLTDGHVLAEGQPVPDGQMVLSNHSMDGFWFVPGVVVLLSVVAAVGTFLAAAVMGTLVLRHRAGWRGARRWGLWLSVPYAVPLLYLAAKATGYKPLMTLYGRWYLPFVGLLILGYASWLLGAAYLLADPAARAWHHTPAYDTPPLVAVGASRRPKRPVRRLPRSGGRPVRP